MRALSTALARELGQASLLPEAPLPYEGDFDVRSRSKPWVRYAMVLTPDGVAVHQGEGCEGEKFNGPTNCWHSRSTAMTQTAVVKQEQILTPSPVEFSAEQIALIKSQIAPGASDGELALFIATCRRTGLDPFMRQIYAIMRRTKDGDKWESRMTIQVGIDGMRLIAERTGKYAGQDPIEYLDGDGAWSIVWTGPTKDHPWPLAAKATVYRKDATRPTVAICRWESYVQTTGNGGVTSMWGKMPDVMLGKCTESLALRRAFPAEMSGFASSIDGDFDAQGYAAEIEAAAPENQIEAAAQEPIEGEIIEAPAATPTPAGTTVQADQLGTFRDLTGAFAFAPYVQHLRDLTVSPAALAAALGTTVQVTRSVVLAWLAAHPGQTLDDLTALAVDAQQAIEATSQQVQEVALPI